MAAALRIRSLHVHRLAIPMRVRFEHASATRELADPVIVGLAAAAPYAQFVGYGETLARPYVTGETAQTVCDDVAGLFAPRLESFRPRSFVEALEFIEGLPHEHGGRVVNAARAAVELALLDLAGQAFRRRAADVAGWLGLAGFGPPGSLHTARYSGIVIGSRRRKLQWLLRAQLWLGLRDFKLKAAVDGWEQRLAWAGAVLGRRIARQRATLRIDANSGWSLADAIEAGELLRRHQVSAVEQPLPDSHDADLPYLAEQLPCDLIADESLLTYDDGQRLAATRSVKVFNIRLAKNGGLLPSLKLAGLAFAHGLDVQLGCLVGETSVLTAAGAAFAEVCPRIRFLEGAFGTRLLREDVTRGSIRFGLGGRVRPRPGFGLGVEVDPAALARLATERERSVVL